MPSTKEQATIVHQYLAENQTYLVAVDGPAGFKWEGRVPLNRRGDGQRIPPGRSEPLISGKILYRSSQRAARGRVRRYSKKHDLSTIIKYNARVFGSTFEFQRNPIFLEFLIVTL